MISEALPEDKGVFTSEKYDGGDDGDGGGGGDDGGGGNGDGCDGDVLKVFPTYIRSHVPGSWAPNWLHGKARIANLPASPPYFEEELLISRC